MLSINRNLSMSLKKYKDLDARLHVAAIVQSMKQKTKKSDKSNT